MGRAGANGWCSRITHEEPRAGSRPAWTGTHWHNHCYNVGMRNPTAWSKLPVGTTVYIDWPATRDFPARSRECTVVSLRKGEVTLELVGTGGSRLDVWNLKAIYLPDQDKSKSAGRQFYESAEGRN